MPNWDHVNPWRGRIVYVPLDILAHCCAGGSVEVFPGNGEKSFVRPNDAEFILNSWKRFGDGVSLDGYILPQPNRRHSIGVRFGESGEQYLSPYNRNPDLTHVLLNHYNQEQGVQFPIWET